MLKKLFSHTAIYGLAPQVPRLASLVALPIITPHLSAVDFGIYGVVTAASGLIGILANLGLRVVLVNSFYKSPGQYRWLWRQLYGFLTLWNLPFAGLSGLVLFWLLPAAAVGQQWTIIGLNLLPVVLFGQTTTLTATFYQVNKRPLPIVLRTVAVGTLTVALNVYTIAHLKMGYMGWFWSAFVSTLVMNFSYWIPLNFGLKIYPIFRFKWRLIRQSLRTALPTIPHYYSSYLLNTSDKVVMEALNVDTAQIGQYNAAYTIGNYFNQLGTAGGLAIGPMLNECYKAGDELKARTLVFAQQVFFLSAAFGVALWLREVFSFLLRNPELAGMYYLGVIVVMAYSYRPMYFGANARLFYLEKTKVLWRVSFVAGAGNVALNFLLIPYFGFEVAAYTTFASLMYMGYSGYWLKAFRTHATLNYYPVQWLALTLGCTVLAYQLAAASVWLKLAVSGLLLPVVLYSFFKLRQTLRQAAKKGQ